MRRIIFVLIAVFAFTSAAQAVPLVWDFESQAATSNPASGAMTSLTGTFGSFSMTLTRFQGGTFDIIDATPYGFPAGWGTRDGAHTARRQVPSASSIRSADSSAA